ncbi:hypothetical protein OS493_022329 [Desmophyllum pertusum]|uniref:EGF-like domain-containing protein n=1 Tax=Desmophyllum pertusum TaxID=174260 RepID=A0A9W9ZZL8_9CNID|nr:hypothetical protein OS493_022329 [Desmophyllum pertusum]
MRNVFLMKANNNACVRKAGMEMDKPALRMALVKESFATQMPNASESFPKDADSASAEMVGKETDELAPEIAVKTKELKSLPVLVISKIFPADGSCEGITCATQMPNASESFPKDADKRGDHLPRWLARRRTNLLHVNECQSIKNNCHLKAECHKYCQASTDCRCKPGYLGDGVKLPHVTDGSCDGVFCDPNAICEEGSPGDQRQCSCREGWRGNGTFCVDIDELQLAATKCDLNADCFNSAGAYQCRCRLGYLANGSQCVSDGTCDGVVCSQHGACVPKTANGRDRHCVCVDGWKGDGRSCLDADECQATWIQRKWFECESDGTCAGEACHGNATCRNLIQGPSCVCKSGYQGPGTACTDTDECDTGDHECNSNADCLNSIGSYNCQCKPGYVGSGFSCQCKYFEQLTINSFLDYCCTTYGSRIMFY